MCGREACLRQTLASISAREACLRQRHASISAREACLRQRHASITTREACLCLRHASISTHEACLLAGMLNYLIESLRQHQINCLIVLRSAHHVQYVPINRYQYIALR